MPSPTDRFDPLHEHARAPRTHRLLTGERFLKHTIPGTRPENVHDGAAADRFVTALLELRQQAPEHFQNNARVIPLTPGGMAA